MSAEQIGPDKKVVASVVPEHNIPVEPEVAPQDSPELPANPNSFETINARLSKRAKELNDRDKITEESQKVTQKTKDLEFDAPGGRLWLLNHQDS